MIRHVITFKNASGQRQLMGPNQGRHFSRTREAAELKLKNLLDNTSENSLIQIFGPQALNTFEVRECECYESGDAKSIYFN